MRLLLQQSDKGRTELSGARQQKASGSGQVSGSREVLE